MATSRVLPIFYNENTYGSNDGKLPEDDNYRDYTSLALWEADTDIDLVTATCGEVLTCYDDDAPYSDYVILAGATTSADYFRVIRAASGQRGTPTSGVRFEIANLNNYVCRIDENYFSLQDIGMKNTRSTTGFQDYAIGYNMFGNYATAIGCTAYDMTTRNSDSRGFFCADNKTGQVLVNCYAYNCNKSSLGQGGGFVVSSGDTSNSTTAYLYNCTAVGNIIGINIYEYSGATIEANSKNCIFQNNSTNISTYGSPTHNQTTNATSGVTFDTDGYHLASTDTGAINKGTDLSADSVFAFDDDIDGQTRHGTWDIGCDEYIVKHKKQQIIMMAF